MIQDWNAEFRKPQRLMSQALGNPGASTILLRRAAIPDRVQLHVGYRVRGFGLCYMEAQILLEVSSPLRASPSRVGQHEP